MKIIMDLDLNLPPSKLETKEADKKKPKKKVRKIQYVKLERRVEHVLLEKNKRSS